MKQKSVIISDLGAPEIHGILDLLIAQISAMEGLKDMTGTKPYGGQINLYKTIFNALQKAEVIYGEGEE